VVRDQSSRAWSQNSRLATTCDSFVLDPKTGKPTQVITRSEARSRPQVSVQLVRECVSNSRMSSQGTTVVPSIATSRRPSTVSYMPILGHLDSHHQHSATTSTAKQSPATSPNAPP
jgi:hypothetical protein